jgi:hypothetical protein
MGAALGVVFLGTALFVVFTRFRSVFDLYVLERPEIWRPLLFRSAPAGSSSAFSLASASPLLPGLAVVIGLLLVARGCAAAVRLYGAVWAIAGAVILARLFLADVSGWPVFEAAVVDGGGAALAFLAASLPLRRAVGTEGSPWSALPPLFLLALLFLQIDLFRSGSAAMLHILLFGPDGAVPPGGRGDDAEMIFLWTRAGVGAALLLVPPLVAIRGFGLLRAGAETLRALWRRPLAFLGSTAVLLVVSAAAWISALLVQLFIGKSALPPAFATLTAGAAMGTLFSLALFLQARFALELTDQRGRATNTISSPPSENGVPSKSP